MRRFVYALLMLCALTLLAAGTGLWYLRSAEPDPERGATIAGLDAPVEVWRDSLAVPHLWAASEADLLRALGYVHAQDRLWQMEMFRRVADGRMAEILGPELIDTDRFLRTLGLGRAAAANVEVLDSESRSLLEAYAQGVNSWIQDHPGALPPEFLALRFRPQPWTVRNSLAISKLMAWDLADWNVGLDLQSATDAVGPELARDLYPEYPEWGVRILGADAEWKGKGTLAPARQPVSLPPVSGVVVPRIPALAVRLLDGISIARASNSWVIGGARTRSGKPILANDPHLALRAPSLWYLAALHGGGINAAGVTIPGTPLVILGHTERVAWGFTNAMVDDVDFFAEQVDPADSARYRTPEGWARFEVRPETIRVKGADPIVHRVRATRHGPVLSDVEERGGSRVLAMRWTALDPSTEVRALLGMNRAGSAGELVRALRGFNVVHQNVVFADADGVFGYAMSGRVPVRRSGDGLLPVPGWTGEAEWERFLEWEEHPSVLNPAEGFIVTANNRQLGPEYPFHIAANWADPFRAMRIRDLIQDGSDFTADQVARQQTDVRDAFALRYLPHAVRAAEAAGERDAAAELRGWTGEARTDSRPAALFYTWYEALRRRVGEDEYRGERMYFPRDALNRVLEAGGGRWVDDVRTARTETLGELAADAMREAVRGVGQRTWGDLHTTEINHALGPARILDRTLDLNIGPFPNGGSPYTVDVAGYGGTRPPFRNSYGASQRHVVDLADPDGAGGFVIPTGQSGLPFSPHYRDQTPLWREGRLWRIPLNRRAAEARITYRTALRPNAKAQ